MHQLPGVFMVGQVDFLWTNLVLATFKLWIVSSVIDREQYRTLLGRMKQRSVFEVGIKDNIVSCVYKHSYIL